MNFNNQVIVIAGLVGRTIYIGTDVELARSIARNYKQRNPAEPVSIENRHILIKP